MSRMAEFDAEIRCFLSEGLNPVQVAHRLCIPLEWVIEYENDEILGRLPTPDGSYDADAISFGHANWSRYDGGESEVGGPCDPSTERYWSM